MGTMATLDNTGDTRLQWDKVNEAEVATAREKFDEFRRRGFAAFRVNAQGVQDKQIDQFDPTAERIILVPQMVGG